MPGNRRWDSVRAWLLGRPTAPRRIVAVAWTVPVVVVLLIPEQPRDDLRAALAILIGALVLGMVVLVVVPRRWLRVPRFRRSHSSDQEKRGRG